MRFNTAALAAALTGISSALLIAESQAFAPSLTFVRSTNGVQTQFKQAAPAHGSFCPCPTCTGLHTSGCACAACGRGLVMLFADATDEAEASVATEEIPTEVVAMDGVASPDEAHNAERPARKELKKKRPPKGKPLSEFAVGSTVKAVVKSVASYGAFCDFGASSDGLLHISRMSKEYVGDVNEVLSVGQEVEVRIVEIDEQKNQIALSLLTETEEGEAKAAQNKSRENKKERRPQGGQQGGGPRTANPVLAALVEKGFDSEKFVSGKVVSTVAFGAFVRVEANQLNEAVEGDFEGLVHISALTAGRASAVTDIVNVDDTVSVRVKSIGDGKVSLTMVSVDDEQSQASSRAQTQTESVGAADWKESLERLKSDMPAFTNSPLIVDMRK